MSWFGTRDRGEADASLTGEGVPPRLLPEAPPPAPRAEPPLVLLAHDASGPACRRLHCFSDAVSAARFVKFWYPYRSEASVIAFWLLRGEPSPHDKVEWEAQVVVLVRDGRPGLVYAISVQDMEAARELVRDEVASGLDPASALLFWVVPVRIENDWRGDTVLFPERMPDGMTLGNAAVTALSEKEMAARALR